MVGTPISIKITLRSQLPTMLALFAIGARSIRSHRCLSIVVVHTIDGSFGAWEHIGQAIEAAIVKLIDHVRDVEDDPNIVPSHIGWKAFKRIEDYEDDPGVFGEIEFVCTW